MAEHFKEVIKVKILSSQQEKNQVIFGNAILPIAKLYERYSKSKKFYEESGYAIVSEDIDKQTFIAEKEYDIDE